MSSQTRKRCWPTTDPLYVAYHDEEWGRPVTDERGMYERLCLEGFQSGNIDRKEWHALGGEPSAQLWAFRLRWRRDFGQQHPVVIAADVI